MSAHLFPISTKATKGWAQRMQGVLAAAGVFAVSAFLSVAPTPAQASCFDARNCARVSAEWSARENGRLNIRVQNTCSRGVTVRLCGLRRGNSEFCEMNWIRGGGRWNTYIYNSSGQYAWRTAGAGRSADAWVCPSRIRGWSGPMRYN